MSRFTRTLLIAACAAVVCISGGLVTSALEPQRGDANSDSVVNTKDVLLLRQYIAGKSVILDTYCADMNGDNAVNTKDVLLLRERVAGIVRVIYSTEQSPDGNVYLLADGDPCYETGLFSVDNKKMYFVAGKFKKVSGLTTIDGKKYNLKDGVLDTSTKLVHIEDRWLYVKSGVFTEDTLLFQHTDGRWLYIEKGIYTKSTLIFRFNNEDCYVKTGVWQKDFSGNATIDKYSYGVKNGVVKETLFLDVYTKSLPVGGTFTLAVSTTPTGTVSFSSNNNSAATVSSAGVVKGVGSGQAVITASCNGASAKCVVNVAEQGTIDELLNRTTLHPLKTNSPSLDNLVDDIFSSIFTANMSTAQKVRACYNYLIDTCSYASSGVWGLPDYPPYVSAYDANMACNAYAILSTHIGVCDNYNAAFAVMCRRIGLPAYTVGGTVTAKAGGRLPHLWSYILLDGKKYTFDPQVQDDNPGSPGYFFGKTYAQTGDLYDEDVNYVPEQEFQDFKVEYYLSVYTDTYADVTYTTGYVEIGGTLQLEAEGLPASVALSWKSSNENIATVDKNGVVTGVSAGTATITVSGTFNGETYSDSMPVKVADSGSEWTIDWGDDTDDSWLDDIWNILF